MFSIPSGSYHLSASSSLGLPEIWGDRDDGALQYRLFLCVMSGSGSLNLFCFVARWSLSENDRIRCWSIFCHVWLFSLRSSFISNETKTGVDLEWKEIGKELERIERWEATKIRIYFMQKETIFNKWKRGKRVKYLLIYEGDNKKTINLASFCLRYKITILILLIAGLLGSGKLEWNQSLVVGISL